MPRYKVTYEVEAKRIRPHGFLERWRVLDDVSATHAATLHLPPGATVEVLPEPVEDGVYVNPDTDNRFLRRNGEWFRLDPGTYWDDVAVRKGKLKPVVE